MKASPQDLGRNTAYFWRMTFVEENINFPYLQIKYKNIEM
jgi:hypothetical protein